jgi:transposase
LLLIGLLRTLWRLSYQDMHDWLKSWPALALACGLPLKEGQLCIPSKSQQCKRRHAAGAPLHESLFVLAVLQALRRRLIGARDLMSDSAPILAWRRRDPDAAFGHAPAHHPRPLLRGFRVHTLICRGSGLPLFFLLSPANAHDAPFAKLLLAGAVRLYRIRPRVVRLDAAYWGLHLIAWIHAVLGAVAVIAWNPKRQKNRSCLPPTWTKEELGKRSSIERFFGRVFLFFHLQRPPLCGWSEIASQVALTYAASIIVGLAAQQAGRPDLIRSPKRVLAHLWQEDSQL